MSIRKPMQHRRILVTGGRGFIGSHLVAGLQAAGHEPHVARLDLCAPASIEEEVGERPWDCVVHLAALANVADCERDPARAEQVNVAGTLALRDAVSRLQPQALLLYTSTAQLYVPEAGAEVSVLDETAPLEARNVYARTKWEGEQALIEGAHKDGLDVTVLRPFNHTHHTQAAIFFLPYLYQAMQRHRALGSTDELEIPVGNLALERDIGAVSDLVGAMVALLGRPGEAGRSDLFNVCSGVAKNLASLGHKLAARLGVRVRFATDAARVRPGEPRSVCGSHARLTAATGWAPRVRTEDELIEAFLG